MGLGYVVLQQIDALAQKRGRATPASPPVPFSIEVEHNGVRAKVGLEDVDRLACSVHRLELERVSIPRPAESVGARLAAQAEALSRRLTYLQEPFAPIEFDQTSAQVQLRSSPPWRKGDLTGYYEVTLRDGCRLSFVRYEKRRGAKRREEIPSSLTREIFVRLVDDLAEILADRCSDV